MIQVYQKNDLFIIEDTVIDVIYPNLSKEEAIEILKRKDREPDRVNYAIKNFIPEKIFKSVALEDNRVLEKALEIAAEKIEFMAQMLGQTLDYDIKENLIKQAKESKKDGRN